MNIKKLSRIQMLAMGFLTGMLGNEIAAFDNMLSPGALASLKKAGVQYHEEHGLNNISFVNDSDKAVYICRDKDAQGEVSPKGTKCFGVEFFNDKDGKPAPRYFKINFTNKRCTETPDIKYALAPGRNYRITTQAALKTDEKWTNGCPPLTPAQQAAEQKSGGVIEKVIVGGAVLAEDIKGGVLKGFDATSNFFTSSAPEAIKTGYEKTAQFITKDVGGAFKTGYETVSSGVEKAGEEIKGGLEAAGQGIKDVANKAADWTKGAAETVKGGFEGAGRTIRGWF